MNFDPELEEKSEEKENKGAYAPMLTGKYDMAVLREIARVEEGVLEELVELYGCEDEDDLPIELDIHDYISMDDADVRPSLEKLLKDCPKATDEWISKFCAKIKDLNPRL